MKVAITGSSGTIGQALIQALQENGHTVVAIVRKKSQSSHEITWDPAKGVLDPHSLEGTEAIINLAGENIASRWSEEKKKKIIDSRVNATKTLTEAILKMPHPPKVLINGSAIGYYGNRGNEQVDESSSKGTGFLSDVCQAWEAATEPAEKKGIRVAKIRTGIVLTPNGGALKAMLTPFKLCLGGVVADGNQYMSWISLDDEVAAILHILNTESLQGPIDLVAPNPVTNREFTLTLGKVLHRPTFLPMPAALARLAFGEMADEMLIGGVRVQSNKLKASGFQFKYPELEGCLNHLLGVH